LPTVQLIYSNWSGCRINVPALSSLLDFLEQPIQLAILSPTTEPLRFCSELRFNKVSFRYGPDMPWVLRNADLSIRRGERIGIVGETGCGKSTIVDLLMGLLEPTMGEFLVDGKPMQGERLCQWRSAVAHVPQSIFLIDASIAENIALGTTKEAIDQAKLEKVCKQAQIAGLIESLDEGYNTCVGERGIRLSGGQRQRIGIARALYKQAAVLVLDEATSALDQATENRVMEGIRNLSKDLTIVIIAHRLSTLEQCDRIARVNQGSLALREA